MKPSSKDSKLQRKSPKITGDAPQDIKNDLLIVAVGASAGGVEALTDLVSNLSADTGMAFVLIQHLAPKHHSLLTELLSKKTSMVVVEVVDGMRVESNHVYVIPPNATLSISDRTLKLSPREDSGGTHMSIDYFMRALAAQQGNRAIGVILSGAGTDGTLGMAEIQAQGGVTFAQDEASAKYGAMPRSAVAAGYVDYVLPPKGIARELARIARHPYVSRKHTDDALDPALTKSSSLGMIFQALRRSTGVDFTHYRETTSVRRIHRRMVVHKLDKLDDYAKFLQAHPAEIKALYQDILINVTGFFRNPAAFEALKSEVFPEILKRLSPELSPRIWTPGCASGEETYSVAIALLEFLGEKASNHSIQIFGTDVSEASIAKARRGLYPANIQADVSEERLRRFFTKVEGGYRISKSIRDMCVFAQHNLLSDPPFSQMDLICCRNLLIYLEPILQSRAISLFHYATRPGGFLLLGSSEGVGTASHLFAPVDRAQKIFSKKITIPRQQVTFSLDHSEQHQDFGSNRVLAKQTDTSWSALEAQKEFDRRVLSQYAPATVLVNETLDIVHNRGNVSRYLKLSTGRASLNILKMAREGLLVDLRNTISRAKKGNTTARKQHVPVKAGDGEEGLQHSHSKTRFLNLEVTPITMANVKDAYFMIVFQDERVEIGAKSAPPKARRSKESDAAPARISTLEVELAATKEYLQSVIETQEATNEELQSANEEILSSNEELQSTNEELETAKEELQSTNEELTTVNDELRSRNQEITLVNNDLTNLLTGIDIAVLMIGSDLTIRRFTPQCQTLLGLIPGDVGRPLNNINPAIDIPEFQEMVKEVMSTSRSVEKDITEKNGVSYQFRVMPARSADNKIDGVVITIIDLSRAKAGGAATDLAESDTDINR